MRNSQVSAIRLINQQIASSECTTAKDVVAWMGAMQAQDYPMVKWAIGQRLPGSTETIINSAIDAGELLRTHLMRPTWHVVSPDDILWLLGLTAPKIKKLMKSRDRELELTELIFSQCNSIIEKALLLLGHLTREELIGILNSSKIKTDENRASHIFMRAELEGLVCSGKTKNNKPTFALLSERAPMAKNIQRDEALAQLAQRYFISHGPATVPDFSWWSGLSLSEAKHALYLVKSHFISESIDGQVYWFVSNTASVSTRNSVYVLPAYDEFLISYKNRTASLPETINAKAVSSNGIFYPVIVVNGNVIGRWKRTIKGQRVIIENEFFETVPMVVQAKIEEAFTGYAHFLAKKLEFKK